MESIIAADKALFLYLNGWHSPFFDPVMWTITRASTWYVMYVAIVVWISFRYRRRAPVVVLLAVVAVILSDLASVHIFKETICRLRPSHNPEFAGLVHLIDGYKGGTYGFVSSHAANSFAIAVYTAFALKTRWYTIAILSWAVLVSYSRIYVGVHYPLDLIGGAATGTVIALLMYGISKKILGKQGISDRSS